MFDEVSYILVIIKLVGGYGVDLNLNLKSGSAVATLSKDSYIN